VAFALLGWKVQFGGVAELLLLVAWLVFAGAGIWLAAVDLRVQRLPTKIIVGAAAVCGSLIVAAALAGGRAEVAVTAGMAAAAVGVAYLAMAVLAPGQLGIGDVRLASLCALLLGTRGWGTVVVGAVVPWLVSAVVAVVLVWTGRARGEDQLPLGPYLIAGTLLALAFTSG